MSSWSPRSTPNGTIWHRPLGIAEQFYYWISTMNGSSDVAQHNQIDVASPHSWVMDPANIKRAWLSTKRRFPLLAAKLVRKANDDVFFEVAEGRVQNLIDGELEIGTLSSDDEVAQLTETFLNGPRELAFDMQAKVKVMALPKRGSHRKNDYYTRFHIWLITSHPVADGAANMSLFTTFMTMLTCPSQRITRQSIGVRLSMVPDGETLHPDPPKSVARKRWRMAIAWAVMKTKEEKAQGGHQMPKRKGLPQPTLGVAASRIYGVHLDIAQTDTILKKCRDLGITLGNTTAVLCQIAHARILHRYRNTLPLGEWEHRIRQPMHTVGPVSMRTRMPPEWQQKGGSDEFFAYVNYSYCTLPHMPFSENQDPSYEELMSPEAFVRRCKSIKAQGDHWLQHPLFHEMSLWRSIPRMLAARRAAKIYEGSENEQADPGYPEWIRNAQNMIFSNEASSFGSMEAAVQKEYPIPTKGVKSSCMIVVREFQAYIRAPAQLLYLTMMGNFGRLWIGCWWDGNTWEDKMAREWVDEVAAAALFYLGETRPITANQDSQLADLDFVMARL